MSNEKQQIEEMALILKDVPPIEFPVGSRMQGRHIYSLKKFAEALYSADYRKQEWISVEDRLPEEKDTERKFYDNESLALLDVEIQRVSDEVLVVVKDIGGEFAFVSTDCTIEGKWQSWENGDYTVTHWMPFPEAPKMKGDSDK